MKETNSIYKAFVNNNYSKIEKFLYTKNTQKLIYLVFQDNKNILHLTKYN